MTIGVTFDWLIIAVLILIFYWTQTSITRARLGRKIFIRRIPGITAIEEAIGRATEMGKPIVYSPGTSGERDVPTYASLGILSYVARLAARLGVRIIVTVVRPTVYPMAESTVREAFRQEGKLDNFVEEDIMFLSENTIIYAMTTANIIERENAACAFFMGTFDFTSLLMTEPGSRLGAIQIAGDVGLWQIPFLISSCDYTIIGEEVYAEPVEFSAGKNRFTIPVHLRKPGYYEYTASIQLPERPEPRERLRKAHHQARCVQVPAAVPFGRIGHSLLGGNDRPNWGGTLWARPRGASVPSVRGAVEAGVRGARATSRPLA